MHHNLPGAWVTSLPPPPPPPPSGHVHMHFGLELKSLFILCVCMCECVCSLVVVSQPKLLYRKVEGYGKWVDYHKGGHWWTGQLPANQLYDINGGHSTFFFGGENVFLSITEFCTCLHALCVCVCVREREREIGKLINFKCCKSIYFAVWYTG